MADDWEKEWDEGKLVEKIEKLKIENQTKIDDEEKEKPPEKKTTRAVKGRGAFKFEKEQEELAQDELNDIHKTLPKQTPKENVQNSPSRESSPRKTNTQVARRMIGNALQLPELQKSKSPDDERLRKKKEPKHDYWDE